MIRMGKRVGLVIFILFTFCFAASASAVTYGRIVVFGDSLSDHNGLRTYLGPLVGDYDPVDNPSGVREVWSNGDVWVEYLAGLWNAELDNRAIAGAMTKGHEDPTVQSLIDNGTLPPLGMAGQVDGYLDTAALPLSDTALYVVWIGGNDLLVYGRGESSADTPEELIAVAVTRINTALNQLYEAGARNFLILNLPDIGVTPAYLSRSEEDQAGATALSENFNATLKTTVDLFAQVRSGVTLHWFDMFAFLHGIIDDGTFADPAGTYLVLDENGSDTGEVNEPASDYLFWDAIHPTTLAHSMIAEEIDYQLDGDDADTGEDDDDSSSDCFIQSVAPAAPSPAWLIWGAALLGLGWVSRKRR